MMTTNRTIDYQTVYDTFLHHGYLLLTQENDYINTQKKCVAKDNEGYIVTISYNKLKVGRKPKRFDINNPYTLQNIMHFININENIDSNSYHILLSSVYEGSNKKLDFETKEGYRLSISWDNLKQGRKSNLVGRNNKHSIYNIYKWIENNNMDKNFFHELLTSKFNNATNQNLEFKTVDGYIISLTWACMYSCGKKATYKPQIIGIHNRHSLYNIKVYINNNPLINTDIYYKIIDEENISCLGYDTPIIFETKEGYKFKKTWNDLQQNKINVFLFGITNEFMSYNIQIYCNKNYPFLRFVGIEDDYSLKFWDDNINDYCYHFRDGRRESLYYQWSIGVKKKFNYTCDHCKNVGGELHSHHLNGYNWFIEGRTDINNGVCLCETCHKEFHDKYGYRNNTKEQFEEWNKQNN